MPLSFTASSTSPASAAVDLLVVPVAKGGALGPGADAVDAALGGGLAAFLEETGFDGGLGATLAVPTAGKLRAQAAILVGIGDPADLTVDALRRAAAAVAKRSTKATSVATTLAQAGAFEGASLDAADAAQAVTEGFVLGGYQYLDYKGDAKPSKLRRVTLLGAANGAVKGAIVRGQCGRRRRGAGARPGEHARQGAVTRGDGRGGAALSARHRRARAGARPRPDPRASASAACSASGRARSSRRAS